MACKVYELRHSKARRTLSFSTTWKVGEERRVGVPNHYKNSCMLCIISLYLLLFNLYILYLCLSHSILEDWTCSLDKLNGQGLIQFNLFYGLISLPRFLSTSWIGLIVHFIVAKIGIKY